MVMPSALIDATREALKTTDALWLCPWADPYIDLSGHDPRSDYVEVYWTPVLGCSSVMLARRLADTLEVEPAGLAIDVPTLAATLGLGHGPTGLITKSLSRLVGFGLARYTPERAEYQLRVRWPVLTRSLLARLPAYLQAAHPT
jgi:hypothetical protein